MSKLEQVFYSAVGELTGIWVTINGERYLFSKESIIREQIAREIEASNVNVFMTTPETIRAHYAAIARGEK